MATAKETWGMLAGAKPFSSGSLFKDKNLKKQIDEMIKNRPQYNIADEVSENQNLAKANLFAPDRAIQQRKAAIDQEATNTAGQVGDLSNSSGALLSTLASIYSDKNKALRDLTGDEAAIRQQKLNTFMAANNYMDESKDKAYAENVKAPYNLKLNELVGRRKNKQENFWKILDTAVALGTFGMGNMGGRTQPGYSGDGGGFTPYPV